MTKDKKRKIKKNIRITLFILLGTALLFLLSVLSVNGFVVFSVSDRILTSEQAAELPDVDCILVLGCGVLKTGEPSPMLYDRLSMGLELYEAGTSEKFLMSGDHGTEDYNEVGTMKDFVIARGIDSCNVFMDHAGFSTYETMYRAKEIFGVKKAVIVTQKYHLFRALYIANELGIDAYGVNSDYRSYSGKYYREAREVLARCKDFVQVIFTPEPTYLGDTIPISGNGNDTNDDSKTKNENNIS